MKTFLKNVLPFNNRANMPAWQFVLKKFLAFWLCFALGLLLSEAAVILSLLIQGKDFFAGEFYDDNTMALIAYYGYVSIIFAALLYWKLIEKKPLREAGLTRNLLPFLPGMLLGAALLALSFELIFAFNGFAYKGVFKNINASMILLYGGSFIIQATAEELLTRGLVLHALKDRTSLPTAVSVSTILFILPHFSGLFAQEAVYGIIGIINLLLISLIFTLLTLRYKSIWAACGLHAFWNFALFNILGLNLSGNEANAASIFNIVSRGASIWNGGAYGIEGSLMTAFVLFLCVCLMHVFRRKGRTGA